MSQKILWLYSPVLFSLQECIGIHKYSIDKLHGSYLIADGGEFYEAIHMANKHLRRVRKLYSMRLFDDFDRVTNGRSKSVSQCLRPWQIANFRICGRGYKLIARLCPSSYSLDETATCHRPSDKQQKDRADYAMKQALNVSLSTAMATRAFVCNS